MLLIPSGWHIPNARTRTSIAIIEVKSRYSCLTRVNCEVVGNGGVEVTALTSHHSPPEDLTEEGGAIVYYSQTEGTMFIVRSSFTRRRSSQIFASDASDDAWEGGDCHGEHHSMWLSELCPLSARYAYTCINERHGVGILNRIHVVNML